MAKASKSSTTVTPAEEQAKPTGKGRPTPSRRDREAANRKPLVGATPADRKAARARLTSERERQRIGLANGEEKYLPAKDRGDQRRFVRNHIDARWCVGEALMPILVIVLVLGFVNSAISTYTIYIVYAFVILYLIDTLVLWLALRRKLTSKFGSMQRGTFVYILSRTFQMRFMRLPKPQVQRGQYPE